MISRRNCYQDVGTLLASPYYGLEWSLETTVEGIGVLGPNLRNQVRVPNESEKLYWSKSEKKKYLKKHWRAGAPVQDFYIIWILEES